MIPEYIDSLRKFLRVLSWTKVLQTLLMVIIIVVGFGIWENRVYIYRYCELNQSIKRINLSEKSISEINTFTQMSDLVIGTQIIAVDLQRNTRTIIFASIDDDRMKRMYDRFLEDIRLTEFPFLSNTDQQNNLSMVNLLNGEYICGPYLDTLSGRVMPEGGVIVSTVCSTAIPTEYGKFVGIVNVYLKREPTAEERVFLQAATKDLANHIYKNDIE